MATDQIGSVFQFYRRAALIGNILSLCDHIGKKQFDRNRREIFLRHYSIVD
jgi:hypothetical protein